MIGLGKPLKDGGAGDSLRYRCLKLSYRPVPAGRSGQYLVPLDCGPRYYLILIIDCTLSFTLFSEPAGWHARFNDLHVLNY